MRIVLHEARFNSLFGVACSLFTLSGYSHGSIIDNDGQRWDTTFKRGYFDKAPSLCSEPEREIIVIDIPQLDPAQFLADNVGRKYDALGLLLWPWRRENPVNWYCFEALNDCLKSGGIDLQLGKAISAKTILAELLKRGYTATITRGRYYA